MAAADAQASAASASLPPLRDVIARHGLAARRSLGQHFLLDLNLTGRIARAAGDLTQGTVIEIGPGPGGLTRALLDAGAAHLVAVERDERCRNVLTAHILNMPPEEDEKPFATLIREVLKNDYAEEMGLHAEEEEKDKPQE